MPVTLIVEDGTGVEGAESYVSVATFQSWATKRGYTIPSGTSDIESLLRKGCDFIERKSFIGTSEFTDQGLSFPRLITASNGVASSTGVPVKLQTTQMLLAMESMNGALTAAVRHNKYTETKIDQIYLKYEDAAKSAGDLYFPAIEDLLATWLVGGGAVIRTVRA